MNTCAYILFDIVNQKSCLFNSDCYNRKNVIIYTVTLLMPVKAPAWPQELIS